MIHPIARIIKDQVITNDSFFLYHIDSSVTSRRFGPMVELNIKYHVVRGNKYVFIGTYMWWNKSIKSNIKIQTNRVHKYTSGYDREVRKSICSASYYHVCHCNGDDLLHINNIFRALRIYVRNYINQIMKIINYMTIRCRQLKGIIPQDTIRDIELEFDSCNMLEIEKYLDDIIKKMSDYKVKPKNYNIEYFKNFIENVKPIIYPIIQLYNKYGDIHYNINLVKYTL